MSERLDELWTIVRSIPRGHVASYGAVGRALRNPVSGLVAGKWMANAPEGVPWWRVVAASGELVIAKRNPDWGKIQRDMLEQEGVAFNGDLVKRDAFVQP